MLYHYSNNAETVLRTQILSTALFMDVIVSHALKFTNTFPPNGGELITLTNGTDYEVVAVTSWVGDRATIVRGVEGVALDWPVGTLVSARLTAGIMDTYQDSLELPFTTDFHLVPNGTTAIDLGTLAADPRNTPKIIVIHPLQSLSMAITLPDVIGVSDTSIQVNIVKWVAGSFTITVSAPTGNYNDNVLVGSTTMTNNTYHTYLGFVGRWDKGFLG